MNYNKAFDIFYDTTVSVKEIVKGGGYTRTEKETILCELKVDIQPYVRVNSNNLNMEEYGLSVRNEKKMYYRDCKDVKEGNYVDYNGKTYKIVCADKDKMGNYALLKAVD